MLPTFAPSRLHDEPRALHERRCRRPPARLTNNVPPSFHPAPCPGAHDASSSGNVTFTAAHERFGVGHAESRKHHVMHTVSPEPSSANHPESPAHTPRSNVTHAASL